MVLHFALLFESSKCGSDETKLPLPSGSEENAGTNRTNKIANTEPHVYCSQYQYFCHPYHLACTSIQFSNIGRLTGKNHWTCDNFSMHRRIDCPSCLVAARRLARSYWWGTTGSVNPKWIRIAVDSCAVMILLNLTPLVWGLPLAPYELSTQRPEHTILGSKFDWYRSFV